MKVGDLVRILHGDHKNTMGLVMQNLRTSGIIMMPNGANRLFSKRDLEVISESG